jgi:hypothetical protein
MKLGFASVLFNIWLSSALIVPAHFWLILSSWVLYVHLFIGRPTFLIRIEIYSYLNLGIYTCLIFTKFCSFTSIIRNSFILTIYSILFLCLGLLYDLIMCNVSGRRHTPAALSSGNNPGTHWLGGWVGPRAGLDLLEKKKYVVPTEIRNPDCPAPSYANSIVG